MQIRHASIFLAVFILLTANLQADEKFITVNYPPDRSVREFFNAGISISIPLQSVDKINVKAENRVEGDIIPDSNTECFSVPLIYGINKIEITAFNKNRRVDQVVLNIFRRSDIESAYNKPPSEFEKTMFHLTNNAKCAQCHIMNPGQNDKKPITISSFSDLSDKENEKTIKPNSTCFPCHKSITSHQYVHGPASVWSCLSCHDPDSAPKYNVKQPRSEVCFGCHTEQAAEWKNKKYIHGPVNIGKCEICHSPHSAPNPYNLMKPTWDLCTSCHNDKKSGRHVLGGMFFKEGHPTKGKPDPIRKGKELSCASCHNPHASDYPNLWALEAEGPFELCLKCHKYYYK
ncbi:MAG: cytochrome c3 family protein [Nitrospirae bacterium]|nr:cytochrome c3 family protein [Nitrospirota bacterium]